MSKFFASFISCEESPFTEDEDDEEVLAETTGCEEETGIGGGVSEEAALPVEVVKFSCDGSTASKSNQLSVPVNSCNPSPTGISTPASWATTQVS